ncbi:acyltransferase family protein [Photobacterium aphoticum]|nr:acyltransferase [Photobacterium aphoticum]PSU55253.1 acyltransferase [Photobacterium aphoticum]GHA59698.1 acyltransferase [Photobacterium aphoticum]
MQHIRVFDSLRGIMALWVALVHTLMSVGIYIPASINKIVNVTYAVDVFIILSGFVIFALLHYSQENYRGFITRRAFRLFPAYLVALAISALTLSWQIDLWSTFATEGRYWTGRAMTLTDTQNDFTAHLLTHLVLLQGLFNGLLPSSDFTFLEPAWSLSLEWQFYLLAPVIFVAAQQRKLRTLCLLALFSAALYGAPGSGFLSNQIHYFLVGILSFYLYLFIQKHQLTVIPVYLLFVCLTLKNIPMATWFLFFSMATFSNPLFSRLKRFFELGVFHYIGQRSYSIYVFHTLLIYPAFLLVGDISTLAGKITVIALTMLFTLITSHFTYQFIELPGIQLGRKLAKKMQQPTPVPSG